MIDFYTVLIINCLKNIEWLNSYKRSKDKK